MTPLKAIRAKCLDCCGDSPTEVRECRSEKTCALWPYRFGTNPGRSPRILSESHKAALKAGRDRHQAGKVSEGISL